jgi:hypothetical protein
VPPHLLLNGDELELFQNPVESMKGKTRMKNPKLLFAGVASLLVLAYAARAFTDEEVKVAGEAKCAKCALKEGDKCQTVIESEKDGKKISYYVVDNAVAKEFHKNVCKEAKKVNAVGTIKEVDGKQQLTASKIELADK